MPRLAFTLAFLLPLVAVAQKPDPWDKVSQLKTGTELRIFKTGNPVPVQAAFADVSDENLIVVIKNVETAIPKSTVDRLDARTKGGSKMRTESRQTETPPDPSVSNPREQAVPSSNSTASVSFGSKPDFQTLYRRTASSTKP